MSATPAVNTDVERGVAETDVETLLAKQAIRENMQNYCRGIDRLDRDLFTSVWHPDATVDYEGMNRCSAAEITDIFMENHRGWAFHSHQITNSTIKVTGDRAVSETYVTAVVRSFPDSSGHSVDMHYRGRYLDRWSKREGRWAIDHRHLITDILSEYDVVDQFAGELPDRADTSTQLARRDRDDPMYELFASLA
jgi:SnoaL-like protein